MAVWPRGSSHRAVCPAITSPALACLYILLQLSSVVRTILPEASQEGLLHPYKSYADVTLFHYHVPAEVSRATWEFAAYMDGPECPAREVHVYLQHGSYPVMSPDNSTFPPGVYTIRTSLRALTLESAYQPHDATIHPVYSPLPGNWFAAAYMPHWDQPVQQEGIGRKCHYSLGSIALWSQVPNIPLINLGVRNGLITTDNLSYFKFYVPAGVWYFQLVISNCEFRTSPIPRSAGTNSSSATPAPLCLQYVSLQGRSLPTYGDEGSGGTSHGGTSHGGAAQAGVPSGGDEVSIEVAHPYTESYYYLLVVAEFHAYFEAEVRTHQCNVEVLGRTFARQFAQITETVSGGRMAVRGHNDSVRVDWGNAVLTATTSSSSSPPSTSASLSLTSATTDGMGDSGDPSLPPQGKICLPVFQLARIKHVQDFSDTFLLQGREWYTTWLALSNRLPVLVQLDILPFVDIGGTLSVGLHLDELLLNATSQLLIVSACVSKGRPPPFSASPTHPGAGVTVDCGAGDPALSLNVTTRDPGSMDVALLIPFPEPDRWFVTFQARCYLGEREVPCAYEEVMVSLEIRIQPCVSSRDGCGPKGVCQESHKGQFFFTACACTGGHRGWACSDDTHAVPDGTLLLTTLLLTLSNLSFVPAVAAAVRRGLLAEATVYAATMLFSTLYHACDQEVYGWCATRYEVLQFCDFFCSVLAFWVTLIAMAGFRPQLASAFHMAGVLLIAIGVEYNRTGLWVFLIPFALGVSVPVASWTVRCFRRRECVSVPKKKVALAGPGVVLAAVGLVLFAFVETEENYQYVHSAWHIVIALSLVFLLPRAPVSKGSANHARSPGNRYQYMTDANSGNDSELFDVAEQPVSSSPVFFVTSDLDRLHPNSS